MCKIGLVTVVFLIRRLVDGNVARTGRRQFVDVDEETFAMVAGVEGEHAVVDVLLDTFALIARSQSATRSASEEASFDALGLSVISDILDDDAPFTISVLSADWASVEDVTGADVTFSADPVSFVVSLAVVERIVKLILLSVGDAFNQIIS